MPYRMKFDADRCVGCFACHTACLDAHFDAEDRNAKSFRTVRKVTDAEKGFAYAICPGCTHCGICAAACRNGAIYREPEYGFYLVDREKCTGCGECERVCPLHVIWLDENRKAQKCDGCIDRLKAGREPACVSVCCLDVISLKRE